MSARTQKSQRTANAKENQMRTRKNALFDVKSTNKINSVILLGVKHMRQLANARKTLRTWQGVNFSTV